MREPAPDAELAKVPAHDRKPGNPEENLGNDENQQEDARDGHEEGRYAEPLERVRPRAGRFALGRRRWE
jgi:hypothetical protein